MRRVACLIALRNHVANVNRAKAQGRNTVKGAHSFVRMTPNHCKHKTAPNMTPLPLPGSKITYNPFRHQHCDNESRNGSSSKQHNRSRGRSQPCFKLFCYFCASRVSNPSVAFVPAVFQTLLLLLCQPCSKLFLLNCASRVSNSSCLIVPVVTAYVCVRGDLDKPSCLYRLARGDRSHDARSAIWRGGETNA